MTNIDDGGPAFPGEYAITMRHPDGGDETRMISGAGMTLRDYFAAHAPVTPESWARDWMEVNGGNFDDRTPGEVAEIMASWCYYYADAMLAERSKVR